MKLRKELEGLKRLVVKVGSNVITRNDGKLDGRVVRILVEDICELIDNDIEIILVSSGAVSLGKTYLSEHMPKEGKIEIMHSASSIGQPKLINTYSRIFEENSKLCSQILLTHDDFRDRKRFLHAKENINVLLKNNITPILNENDSISYSEITVGDNDHLAAQTAQMINADALLVVTSTDGLFTKDPAKEGAEHISHVPYGYDLSFIDYEGSSSAGRGGMGSKIMAVEKITPLGIKAIISSRKRDRIIIDAITKTIGTFFYPKSHYDPEHRKAWLLSIRKPHCAIGVDRGAFKALKESKSLLPKGITSVKGAFFKGDCVEIMCEGEVFASGICEYNHFDIERIMGNHSDNIEEILGFKTSAEVVHTINLVLDKENENENESVSK